MTFNCNLTRVGVVARETGVILGAYQRTRSWDDVRRLTLQENLLGKHSTTRAREIGKSVRRRFHEPRQSLPGAEQAARFFSNERIPERARAQVAFLYVLADDALTASVHDQIVIPRLTRALASLHGDEVLQHLASRATESPELGKWSPSVRRKWASAFLSLLRDGGFMMPPPLQDLARPSILPAAFGFVFGSLASANGSAKAALDHPLIRWWAIDPAELRTLLAEGQDRGWWRFAFRGNLFDFHPEAQTPEALIDALG